MRSSLFVLSILLLLSGASAFAASEDEMIASEKAFEDAKGTENFQILFDGKLMLGASQEEGVVGIFMCDKHAYQLKLEQPDLLERLRPLNGKSITLKGRPRVNGKYFFAQDIAVTRANPVVPLKRPRGGGL